LSVSGTDNRVQSTGDGTTREFAFTFRIFAKGDLVVYNDTDLQVLDSDYEVKSDTFLADGVSYDFSEGGYVYFAEASTPATGDIITIVRTLTATQGVNLTVGGPLPVESVERMSDRLTMLVQQLIENIARSMVLPVTVDYDDVSMEMPSPEASKVIGWDSDGKALENYDNAATSLAGAEAARDAAETAQGLAETAQAAAESAKGDAETAQGKAEDSADLAEKWAEEAEDTPVETGKYSALHWATKAEGMVSGVWVDLNTIYRGGIPA
jgi:hypothetical protein